MKSVTKIYGGFFPTWQAGRLERQIVDILAEKLSNKYSTSHCCVMVPSWHEPEKLITALNTFQPDITVICGMTMPIGSIEDSINQLPTTVKLFGYTDTGIQFDFWAVACLEFFKKYHNSEIFPKKIENLFLNYNRKPHIHRLELVKALEDNDLANSGIITVANTKYTVNDLDTDFVKYGALDALEDIGIPNDIYSLGQLDIWNSSFLNIVSEAQYEYSPNPFVSEKIFKPIIGLRPFIVNGSPNIYRWLTNIGFDCFSDLFPVQQLANEEKFDPGFKFRNHPLIVDCVKQLVRQDLDKLYISLLPRLLKNRELFYEYANEQKNLITTGKFDI